MIDTSDTVRIDGYDVPLYNVIEYLNALKCRDIAENEIIYLLYDAIDDSYYVHNIILSDTLIILSSDYNVRLELIGHTNYED